jgi:DnaK suppressor protein
MNQEDLDFFKELLLKRREQAAGDLKEFERVADRGTDAMEREKNLLFAQREGSYIDYLDEALQRVEAGTFGSCRVCNEDIGRPRLEAVPTATQCISCKSKEDKGSS